MLRKLHSLCASCAVLARVSVSAESADDLKPPNSYRQWFHVNTMIVDKASPLFADLGGMHNVYINSIGLAALKKGGPYPNNTMFVTDLHDFTVSDGSYVGLPVLRRGRPEEAGGDRRRQAMLRVPRAAKGQGLRVFDLYSVM